MPAAAFCLVLLAVGAVPTCATSESSQVTPVEKVIQLLNGMMQKGKDERHAEQVQFAAFKKFCDDTTVAKKVAIEAADESIDVLKAEIEKNAEGAARLAREIAQHEDDIGVWNGDVQASTKVRELERRHHVDLLRDYSESIDALQRAVTVLEKQNFDRKQQQEQQNQTAQNLTSLAQVSALKHLKLIPEAAKSAIDAFLQDAAEPASSAESPQGLEVSAPEANAYEFQSSSIINILKKLHVKFSDERTTLEKEEANDAHEYSMLNQLLAAQIGQAEEDSATKKGERAKKLAAKASAEGDLQETTTVRNDDQKYLDDLTGTCEQKGTDFVSRQQLRTEELEAIAKAVEIISSSSGVAASDSLRLLQVSRHDTVRSVSSFAHIRSVSSASKPSQQRAAEFLSAAGHRLKSRKLSMLAERAAADPFEKVRQMIKDLIMQLMEEANQEITHKGWCDTELSTNQQTRKELGESVETLHTEIDELTSSIALLTQEIAAASKMVSEIDAATLKASAMRAEEKENNAVTIKDAQEGQVAAAEARLVLKEFYAKAGQATALVQEQPVAPEIFDGAYQGMQGEGGGVVNMLEVIESDFAKLEFETETSEATALQEHKDFMNDSAVSKAQKLKDIDYKTAKSGEQQNSLTTKKEDVEGLQKELTAAIAYFDKLKPSCIDSGVSYEDRVQRRQEEIESLQTALKILNDADVV